MSSSVPPAKRMKHGDDHDKENDGSSTVSTASASKASEGGVLVSENQPGTDSSSVSNGGGNLSNEGGWDGDDEELIEDSVASTGDTSSFVIDSSENTEVQDDSDTDGETCETESFEELESTNSMYEPSSSSGSDSSSTSSSGSSSSTSEDEDDLTDYTLAATDKYYQCGSANMPRRR